MRKLLVPIAIIAACALSAVAGATAVREACRPVPYSSATQATPLPYCATEDSLGCVWDAAKRGNGEGRSFFAYADGTVLYLGRP